MPTLTIGHYTAMVWSNTKKVGCGVTEYKDGKWFAKLYTCNYGPAGNESNYCHTQGVQYNYNPQSNYIWTLLVGKRRDFFKESVPLFFFAYLINEYIRYTANLFTVKTAGFHCV